MEYSSNIDYWLNKPSEEQLAMEKAKVRVDFTRLDMSDPLALEKWKYPSRFETVTELGDRAVIFASTTPEAA